MLPQVKLYTRRQPIFDEFNITPEVEKALRPKVWLKSGGYIVINQTEALVAIDVNTGKYVGKSDRLEDTIVMPEAWIGPSCRLKRCVIGLGVELPAGFETESALVCADPGPGTSVSESTRRSNGLLIHPLRADDG